MIDKVRAFLTQQTTRRSVITLVGAVSFVSILTLAVVAVVFPGTLSAWNTEDFVFVPDADIEISDSPAEQHSGVMTTVTWNQDKWSLPDRYDKPRSLKIKVREAEDGPDKLRAKPSTIQQIQQAGNSVTVSGLETGDMIMVIAVSEGGKMEAIELHRIE